MIIDSSRNLNVKTLAASTDIKQNGMTIFNMLHPVGSIFYSTRPDNPGTLYGIGTWTEIGEGRVLMGVGGTYVAKDTGGVNTVTLNTEQMPGHAHTLSTNNTGGHTHGRLEYSTGGAHTHTVSSYASGTTRKGIRHATLASNESDNITNAGGSHTHTMTVSTSSSHTHTCTINNTGSGVAHNNMMPYVVVYMWERTA